MLSKEREYEKVKNEYHIQKNKYEYKHKSTLKLLDVPCGDKFPQCKYIKDSHEDKKQLNDINVIVEELYRKHGDIEKEYYELKNKKLEEIIKKYDEAIKAELTIKNLLSKLDSEIISKTNESISLEKELTILNNKLPKDNNEEQYKDYSDLIVIKNREIQNSKSKLQKDFMILGDIKSNHLKLLEEQKRYIENYDNYQIYEFLYNCFSKKGLSNLIIKTFLPIINNEISDILKDIFDFNVEIVLDENKQELDVYLIYENSYRTIEMGSGMEKTIASIAIRVALRNITTLSKPDFFIIDEGFGTLDGDNIESCGKLLQKIKAYFRFVLVITHVPNLNQYMDNIIMIQKNNEGYSYMNIVDKLNYNKNYD
jgi:exonuclease SbcC